MANPEIEMLARRIQDLEEQIQGLQQHGLQHAHGGMDETYHTQGIMLWGDNQQTLAGALQLYNKAVPTKIGWVKMNESGDVYINVPAGRSFVVRFDDASDKFFIGHDGTDGTIRCESGKLNLVTTATAPVVIDDSLYIGANQVVGARVVDARANDITEAAFDALYPLTAGLIDSLRDAMITHGLVAA